LAWKQNDFLKFARGGTYLLSDSVVAFIGSDHHDDLVQSGSVFHIRKNADYIYWYFKPDFSDTVFVKHSNDPANYTILTDFPPAGSLMKTDFLHPDVFSFAKASPRALSNALFRPYTWEMSNPLLIVPALENLLTIALLFLLLLFPKKTASPAL